MQHDSLLQASWCSVFLCGSKLGKSFPQRRLLADGPDVVARARCHPTTSADDPRASGRSCIGSQNPSSLLAVEVKSWLGVYPSNCIGCFMLSHDFHSEFTERLYLCLVEKFHIIRLQRFNQQLTSPWASLSPLRPVFSLPSAPTTRLDVSHTAKGHRRPGQSAITPRATTVARQRHVCCEDDVRRRHLRRSSDPLQCARVRHPSQARRSRCCASATTRVIRARFADARGTTSQREQRFVREPLRCLPSVKHRQLVSVLDKHLGREPVAKKAETRSGKGTQDGKLLFEYLSDFFLGGRIFSCQNFLDSAFLPLMIVVLFYELIMIVSILNHLFLDLISAIWMSSAFHIFIRLECMP